MVREAFTDSTETPTVISKHWKSDFALGSYKEESQSVKKCVLTRTETYKLEFPFNGSSLADGGSRIIPTVRLVHVWKRGLSLWQSRFNDP